MMTTAGRVGERVREQSFWTGLVPGLSHTERLDLSAGQAAEARQRAALGARRERMRSEGAAEEAVQRDVFAHLWADV